MSALNSTTRRRLKKLPQIPSVWEGDRCPLSPDIKVKSDGDDEVHRDCILWVDGTEAVVRAIDMVPAESGSEAVVRALMRAIEHPHSPAQAARPRKIVVRDRELQFYLRGVLQDLEIVIDYAPDLPLIDEIARGIQQFIGNQSPQLPPELAEPLMQIAQDIWEDAPWKVLDDAKIFSIDLNYGDVETLYVSTLGLLGEEYGVLMYRSLDSLRNFRRRALAADESLQAMEAAFLEQDCFYLTFDPTAGFDMDDLDSDVEALAALNPLDPTGDMQAAFGNLHPLEGMRPFLYEEEALTVLVALSALHRFFQQQLAALDLDRFPKKTGRYQIPDPANPEKKLSVKVATLPAVAKELTDMMVDAQPPELPDIEELNQMLENALRSAPSQLPTLRDDLMPENAHYSIGSMPWDVVGLLRQTAMHHQVSDRTFPETADGFPIVLIQTSRPKAIALIEALQTAGGLKAIVFNPGEDPLVSQQYDLGILQTHNQDMHLFGEFEGDDPVHIEARRKWDQRCKKTKGHCGLVIARGLKGASKGNPGLSDMMALFEVRSLSAKELGLGTLRLLPQFD